MSSSVPEVVKKAAESSHKMKENSVKVSLKLKEAKTVVETKMPKKRPGIAKNGPGIAQNRPKMYQTRPKMDLNKPKTAKNKPKMTSFGSDVKSQEPCELLSHILPAKWSLEPAMPNPTTKIEPDITTAVADGKKLPTSNFLSANLKTNVSTAALDSTSATNFGNFSKTAKPKPKVSTKNLYDNLSKKTFQNEEQFLAFKLETNSGPSSRPNPILGPRFTPKPLLIGNRLLAPQILDMKRFAGAMTQQMTTDKIVEEKGNLNLSLKILVTSNLCKPLNLL